MRREDYPLTTADQLDYLFQIVLHPANRQFTEVEVAKASGISFAAINHIRTGRSLHPAITTMKCLARFFKVPLSYFEAETYEECRAIVAGEFIHRHEKSDAINQIALRAAQISPQGLQNILQIIGWVQAAEREKQQTELN